MGYPSNLPVKPRVGTKDTLSRRSSITINASLFFYSGPNELLLILAEYGFLFLIFVPANGVATSPDFPNDELTSSKLTPLQAPKSP